MSKRKWTKEQTVVYKTLHRKQEIEEHEPYLKTGGELWCPGQVGRSCITCGSRRDTLVTTVISN